MRKIMAIICMLFLSIMLAASAAAETVLPGGMDIPTEPLTWTYLGTILGCATFTMFVVQYAKVPLDKVWKIPTRLLVYVIALAIMVTATAFTTGLTVESAILSAGNALLASLVAMGGYDLFLEKNELNEKPPDAE